MSVVAGDSFEELPKVCRLCARMHMDVFVASVCALDLNACRSFILQYVVRECVIIRASS